MTTTRTLRSCRALAALSIGLIMLAAACGSASESETLAPGDVVPVGAGAAVAADTGTPPPEDGAGVAPTPAESDPAEAPAADATATASAPITVEEAQGAYREFTNCMIAEGVAMPPAVFDAEGKIDLDAQTDFFAEQDPSDGDFEPEEAEVAAAEAKCIPENGEELLAVIAPDASDIRRAQDEMAGQFDQQLADLTRCMRETFSDFPDPVGIDLDALNDESGDAVEFDPFPGIDVDDPTYADAFLACDQSIGLGFGSAIGSDN